MTLFVKALDVSPSLRQLTRVVVVSQIRVGMTCSLIVASLSVTFFPLRSNNGLFVI
jgi:hypothetical protein